MTGRILKLVYQLHTHRVLDWTPDRLGVALAWGAVVVLLARWWVRGMPALPAWHWTVLALMVLAGVAALWLRAWAVRRQYVVFTPALDALPPAGCALDPEDKVQVHVTGRFTVQGKSGVWADLLAYWRTFRTREHTVMAIVHRSRFLLIASRPEVDLGMWYIFFQPQDISTITPGVVAFGPVERPALRVAYRSILTTSEKRGRTAPRLFREVAYLAFDDESARQAVWADLLAD